MKFELKPLPYAYDALEPHLGATTLETHYEKHHRGYLKKLEKAIGDSPLADRSLEQIIVATANDPKQTKAFNSGAQVFNHDLYWRSMQPGGGGEISDPTLREAIESAFGSEARFLSRFKDAAKDLFGSGWVWLTAADDGSLSVEATKDADNPLTHGGHPIFCCDVWEHAYYLDYKNERGTYVERFLGELVSWEQAAERLRAVGEAASQPQRKVG